MIPAGPTKTANTHQKPTFSGAWLRNWLRNYKNITIVPIELVLHDSFRESWKNQISEVTTSVRRQNQPSYGTSRRQIESWLNYFFIVRLGLGSPLS